MRVWVPRPTGWPGREGVSGCDEGESAYSGGRRLVILTIYTLKTVAFYGQNQIDTRLMQVFTPSPSLLRQCPDCQARYHLNHLSWPGYAIPVYTTYE